ncbi:hypothetical protein DICVIV_09658 [Dictyocaulus viviparus]|uniref:Uncharacterized protein n=1 Tax=Dictyocaulus viviparus TaxID=29172 RepID=A0A0D8XPL9_DICVI|nr:hypothetical protein DICVIV_09658 [Dictyocaulus viviparus]
MQKLDWGDMGVKSDSRQLPHRIRRKKSASTLFVRLPIYIYFTLALRMNILEMLQCRRPTEGHPHTTFTVKPQITIMKPLQHFIDVSKKY